jgi:hypothetical protein
MASSAAINQLILATTVAVSFIDAAAVLPSDVSAHPTKVMRGEVGAGQQPDTEPDMEEMYSFTNRVQLTSAVVYTAAGKTTLLAWVETTRGIPNIWTANFTTAWSTPLQLTQ